MAIANGRGITGYEDLQPPRDGAPTNSTKARPRANPLAPQVTTALFGGTETDGLYTATWTNADGGSVTASVTRAGAVPATNADLAAAFADDLNAQDAWANVASAEVDGTTPEQVNLQFLHAGQVWTLTASAAPAPGTLTIANTSNAGGAPIPVGRFLISVPNLQDPDIPAHGLPVPATTAAEIIGFSVLDGSVENSGLPDPTLVESIPAGHMISSAYDGAAYATNIGGDPTVERGDIFVVVNPAGGDPVGAARTTADGGNTVQLTQAQAYWLSPGLAAGERGRLFLNDL
jgi:hypothetical protein